MILLQIVIGGKNKYMINGKTVQQSEIQNMFHSVQLNVNNPHFLIMQGRITKVLNHNLSIYDIYVYIYIFIYT
jgi:structural maintenance of chromosome 2